MPMNFSSVDSANVGCASGLRRSQVPAQMRVAMFQPRVQS